ncbi:hypothetical protein OSG_eHP31_00105 [environmental Halophage eHP-31]|nr:hypothetical protein OSG_eHP31_00105 [environmental Halophage eHP-31]
MIDYDIDIRSVVPEYKHTLARLARREVADGLEVHLATLTVDLAVVVPTGERERTYFQAVFKADHEAETLRLKSVGDAHDNQTSFSSPRLITAVEYAERAAIAYLDSVGLDYRLVGANEQLGDANPANGHVSVHTDLEVGLDE